MRAILLIFWAALISAISAHLILQPPRDKLPSAAPQAALIFGGGFSLSPDQFEPVLKRLQTVAAESAGIALWVAVPKLTLNLPIALWQFKHAVSEAYGVLQQQMTPAVNVPVFYGGHSRGGQLMLELAAELTSSTFQIQSNADDMASELPKPAGLVLLSSGILRKYRWPSPQALDPSLPVLTLAGDLDGLFRVFRLAESFWHQYVISKQRDTAAVLRPALVLRGANHMSMASGTVPPFVALHDIPAELEPSAAHDQVAEYISTFVTAQVALGEKAAKAKSRLSAWMEQQRSFFNPILGAMVMEGSYHLRPACNDLPADAPQQPCWRGSPWAEVMQEKLADLPRVRFTVTDAFWKVYLVNPVHLPEVHSKCQHPDSTCSLNVTTVTQATYPLIDGIDSGLPANSAFELRSKFKSRQVLFKAAGISNASFSDLDDNNDVCKRLNQFSLDYAQQQVPVSILKRFRDRQGIELRVGEDLGPFNIGPTWIWKDMTYKMQTDANGVKFVEVRSATMRTPDDYPVKLASGFHYCKLLSPARALEWIYTDGLKPHPLI